MSRGIGIRYQGMGIVLFAVFILAALTILVPEASAQGTYFNGIGSCNGCHVGQVSNTWCGMCHRHGTHTSGSTGINVTAATNKASYAPGETVSVTVSGGNSGRQNRARAILYDQSGNQVALSTGTPSSGGGPVNAALWPVTLSAPAPTTPGTYTWKAAWYGNQYDSGGATFGATGTGWIPDPNNPDHGEERVSINSFTVVAASPTLSSIAIVGASSVNEGATSTYTATATWSNGTTSAATGATWSVTSGPATINATTGVLTGGTVTANTSAVIGASYTSGGVTKTASATVQIVDVPAAVTLSSIAIVGASSVNEGATSTYTATATWSNGTTSAATGTTWSVTSGPATINATTGVLTGGTVTANTSAVIGASYTSGGVTKTASATVQIVDVAATTGTVTVYPTDGAANVPVNTVIRASLDGTGDIRTIFNSNTFRLRSNSVDDDSSVGPAAPLLSAVCVNDGAVLGSITYNSANTTATFTPNCNLAYRTDYESRISTSTGSSLSSAVNWRFTTVASSPDSDDDGAPDDEDDDPEDDRKASRWDSKGHGKFRVDSSRRTGDSSAPAGLAAVTSDAILRSVMAMSDGSARLNQAGSPEGYEFPDGMVSFMLEGVAPGSSVTVTITFPSGIPAGSKMYQVDENGFHEMASGVVTGDTMAMTFTNNGTDNTIVVDPVGLATPVSGSGSVDVSTGGASGGGCAVVGRSGSIGGLRDLAGSYGVLILAALGMALRGRVRRREK